MIAYKYNDDGIFAGVQSAQKHPLKAGEYLLPKNATFIEPPTGYTEEFTPCFNSDLQQWSLVVSPSQVALDREKLSITNEYGVSLYYADENGKPVLRDEAEVLAESNIVKKEYDIENLRKTMNINILNKAAEVTNGSSFESIQAFISSYQLKAANASEYVADGLKAHYANGNYAKDDLLDTEAKISEYYKGLLILLDKFRDAEILKYSTEKANL